MTMIRMLLITAALFAFVQAGTAVEENGRNNPRGKFLKPQTKQLINRELASWKVEKQEPKPVKTEFGKASWYGPGFDGKITKHGDVFDMNQVSFAHNKFPKDTFIRVTNLNNGLSVEGRVNDTGGFGKYKRIADLSQEAMRQIGGLQDGVIPVKIEVLYLPPKNVNRSS